MDYNAETMVTGINARIFITEHAYDCEPRPVENELKRYLTLINEAKDMPTGNQGIYGIDLIRTDFDEIVEFHAQYGDQEQLGRACFYFSQELDLLMRFLGAKPISESSVILEYADSVYKARKGEGVFVDSLISVEELKRLAGEYKQQLLESGVKRIEMRIHVEPALQKAVDEALERFDRGALDRSAATRGKAALVYADPDTLDLAIEYGFPAEHDLAYREIEINGEEAIGLLKDLLPEGKVSADEIIVTSNNGKRILIDIRKGRHQ